MVGRHDTDAERDAARQRMLDHYLHTAHAAAVLLHPRFDLLTITAAVSGVMPEEIADGAAALAWFEAEYAVLLGTIQLAADTGHSSHAWQLPHELTEFFNRRGHWTDWVATERIALSAAKRYDDRTGQAHAHRSLGRGLGWLGHYDEAHDHLRQAINLFTELADEVCLADTYIRISSVFEQQDKRTDALAHAQRALELSRTAGSQRGLAQSLNNVGWFHSLVNQPEEALSCCRQALTLSQEIGDRRVQAHALDSLGYAAHLLGRYHEAIDYFQQAIAINRELGERHSLAIYLEHLGNAYHASGNHDAACHAWRQALAILDQLGVVSAGSGPGHPDASKINTKLHRLDTPASPDRPTR